MRWRTRAGWAAGLAGLSVIGFLTTEGTFETYAQIGRVNLIVTEVKFQSLYDRRKAALVEELEALDTPALKERLDGITAYPDPDDTDYLADRLLERRWWMRTWLPGWLRPAQMRDVVFVETPADWLPYDEAEQAYRPTWCAAQGINPLACGPGPLARDEDGELYLAYQRELWCHKVMPDDNSAPDCAGYFAEQDSQYRKDWDKARKDAIAALPDRNLSGVDLRKAKMSGARMDGANLYEARMERAHLWGARMEGAHLWKARMEGANLTEARMDRAVLREARLEGADLLDARIEGANLLGTRVEGARLSGARMEGADLRDARIEGANLRAARMEGANLFGARMEEADLSWARMEGAENLTAAVLRGAAFRSLHHSKMPLTQEQVNSMFGDSSVILPEGVARPDHWPDWELPSRGEHAFGTEWRKWQADPEGYTPPPAPE